MNLSKLCVFIQSYWPLTAVKLNPLQIKGGRAVYKIKANEGCYVVKISNSAKDEKKIKRDLYILEHGHEQAFTNVPKILKTKDKNTVAPYEDRFAFMMEFVDGGEPEDSPESWSRIALLASQLHDFKGCPYQTYL